MGLQPPATLSYTILLLSQILDMLLMLYSPSQSAYPAPVTLINLSIENIFEYI